MPLIPCLSCSPLSLTWPAPSYRWQGRRLVKCLPTLLLQQTPFLRALTRRTPLGRRWFPLVTLAGLKLTIFILEVIITTLPPATAQWVGCRLPSLSTLLVHSLLSKSRVVGLLYGLTRTERHLQKVPRLLETGPPLPKSLGITIVTVRGNDRLSTMKNLNIPLRSVELSTLGRMTGETLWTLFRVLSSNISL